ncbi:glycoside hydrolase family 31 protein [Paenibacillus sp. FSL R7-0297]|uniref:glycoside hydrolase family 31 protein n=1 Tax=unclassified Paenibacillus TaxID=185978 RepID=UPI0004F920B3|nr:glycoside hydrolase family 31 protein [Paenibacillus sp. FSL R5-0912]AIQ39557.1 family 31 glucosidase [Paenibacillus sp. FSL R5-0912]
MDIFQSSDNRLIWQGNGETLCLEAWGKDSLRVRSAMMGDILDTDYALLAQDNEEVEIVINGHEASIRHGKLKAILRYHSWFKNCRISFYNQEGTLLLEELDNHGSLNLSARKFKPIIGGDFRLTASFESNAAEKLYGMGQYQQDILNIKYCNLELAHRNSQASVPFVLSSLGYGLLWHNPAVGRVSFGKNVTEWVAESTKQLDYWITAGDAPADIEANYASVTGFVPMMPEYGLGFWQCKLRYWNQEQLLEVAREYKRRSLPIDVIVCDFFHWPKMGDFRFEEEFFPDPKAMVEELKQLGIELMVSVWPQIDLQSENFEEMRQKNLLVKPEMGVNICMRFGGESVFYDATNPEARRYVWKKCKENYYDSGIQLFWLDEAEPEYGVYDFDNYRYRMGPNVQVGNIYPQLFSRTFYDGMIAEGQRNVVNLVRCAWAGSQRYGALVWSGDIHSSWTDFRRQLCAGLNMGIAGIPWWTTDIGGFSGGDPGNESFRELLVRWFQYGAFCPVMRLHGDRQTTEKVYRQDGSEALFTGNDNEVWSFGEEVYPVLVKYMNLREAMRPYTRSLMQEAHEKGSPVIRPMFYDFPQEETCWELEDQYMFGPDMLVAPVLEEGASRRSVYLPAGARWTELHSGSVYAGGQTLEAAAPLEIIPVFLKNGAWEELVGMI